MHLSIWLQSHPSNTISIAPFSMVSDFISNQMGLYIIIIRIFMLYLDIGPDQDLPQRPIWYLGKQYVWGLQ